MTDLILSNPIIASYAWLIIAILFLLAELATPGLFFFIAFAIGSVLAAIAAYLCYLLVVQCLVALGGMIVSFFIIRYYFSIKTSQIIKTNIDALINQEALVIKDIEPNKFGRVKINREQWPAESEFQIKKGMVVKVIAIKGNRVLVK